MSDTVQGFARDTTIGNTALDNLQARVPWQQPVMAQRVDLHVRQFAGLKNSLNKMAADFAGRFR